MKTPRIRLSRRREQGSVAVEAAVVLPILILFIAVPLFVARVFWYYSVAEKAAHDGARFMSQATRLEMQSSTGGAEPGVAVLARDIANDELDGIRSSLAGVTVTSQCDGLTCGGQVIPSTVRVAVQITVRDNILGVITDQYFGPDGLLLTSDVTMRYAGN